MKNMRFTALMVLTLFAACTPMQTVTPQVSATVALQSVLITATPKAAPTVTETSTSTPSPTQTATSTLILSTETSTPTATATATKPATLSPAEIQQQAEQLADRIVIDFPDQQRQDILRNALIQILIDKPFQINLSQIKNTLNKHGKGDVLQYLTDKWKAKYPNFNFPDALEALSKQTPSQFLRTVGAIEPYDPKDTCSVYQGRQSCWNIDDTSGINYPEIIDYDLLTRNPRVVPFKEIEAGADRSFLKKTYGIINQEDLGSLTESISFLKTGAYADQFNLEKPGEIDNFFDDAKNGGF